MKKFLALILSLLLVVAVIPFTAVAAVAEEVDGEAKSGASDATYVDVADYTSFMAQIVDGRISKSIRLVGDVVFPENTVITSEIAALADGVVIDGNGYSIKGFSMSAATANMGLFAIADGATVTVKNLTIGSAEEGGTVTYELTPTAESLSFGVVAANTLFTGLAEGGWIYTIIAWIVIMAVSLAISAINIPIWTKFLKNR